MLKLFSNNRQFLPQGNTVKVSVQPQRLIETQPITNQPSSNKLPSNQRNNLISTDKIALKGQNEGRKIYEMEFSNFEVEGGLAANSNQLAGTMNFNASASNPNLRPTSQQK